MKRYFFSLALALLAGAVTYSASMKSTVKTDSDGHVLTALWAQYEAASKADKPKTEAEILTRIREAAEKDHLPVDFYDAATRYVSSVQRRDWKQRETLRSQLSEQVKAFDEPIVTFLWMQDYGGASTDELWAYVKAHENGFQGAHKPFFRNVDGYMGGALKEFIASDREYVLWRMLERRSYDKIDDDQVYRDLRDLLGDSYPDGPYLAYYRASHLPDKERTAAWQALADQYAHKAVALYPRQDLLTGEFSALTEKKASAAEFKALYDRALAYEKERGAFKGDEALIAKGCTAVKNLATRLTAQAVSVGVKDGKVRVFLKNVSGVDVILYDGDNSKASVLRKWSLKNPQGSFYVTDTLETALPALGDGDYYIEAVSGKNTAACSYSQHTLSIATRQDARGLGVYVTDYQSGKPLDKVSLKLWKGDRLVLEREGFTLDGFTLLPEKFRTTVESNARIYYSLSAETGSGTALRTSGKISARPDNYSRNTQSSVRLNIYRDRGAYNPGDTMQFKAILYQGHPAVKFETLSGKKLTAVLSDPEGNEIQRKQFTTNEFGSISGAFYLPEGKRNGYWSLEILNGKDASWDLFRVDEFVLPTFDLSFLPGERLYLPGDEVTVSGRLQSYSGHNLSGARLSVRVEHDGTVVSEQELVPDADNAFTFVFRALDSGWYGTTVTVTDATGETHEFFHSVFVVESISVSVDVQDAAPGEFLLMDENQTPRPVYYGRRFPRSATSKYLLSGDLLRMTLQVNNVEGEKIPLPVSYVLTDAEDREVRRGTVDSGTQVEIDLSDCKSGVYKVRAWASTKNARGGEIKDEHSCSLLLLRRDDTLVDAPVRRVFSAGEREVSTGSPIRFQFGCVDGEQWAIVTLFGLDREILETRKVHLDGVGGKKGSLATVSMEYKASYPDAVRVQVFYFKRGESVTFTQEYCRSKTRLSLPLSFSRFTSKALPGAEYTFTLKTDAGVEALAAVWDKSLDEIAANDWSTVSTRELSAAAVPLNASCGRVSGRDGYEVEDLVEMDVMASRAAMKKTATRASLNTMDIVDDSIVMEGFLADAAESTGSDLGDVAVRSVFSSALTFQPHLRPSPDGTLSFSFRTSDKLSTYYVAVYAHDKALRNALVKDEMQVSLPVKVAVVEPGFLYQGDVYDLSAAVSSIVDTPVSGRLCVYVYDNADGTGEPLSVQQVPVTVGGGETLSHRFRVAVPEVRTLSFKVAFVAPEFSDAVLLPVPVSEPAQTLREAHSAVLRAGADREALLADLRSRFVNVPGSSALLKEITVLDMVKEAIPGKVDPAGQDVLSLSEAWYVRLLSGRLTSATDVSGNLSTEELLDRILACRNADGGFGWFEGMTSSAVITAVLLERMAKLRDRGFSVPDMTSSVKFLDESQLGPEFPVWRGWVSTAQYLHVRALYPAVPFTVNPSTVTGKKRMAEFKKYVKDYLVPSKADGRGLQGQILAKARRIYTLKHLSGTSEGIALAKAWGVTFAAKSKLQKSLQADVVSLLEYAVQHRDGGWYYPNAVMPWRGLLESEAYAHALLCDLLTETGASDEIPDGIRLYLMLQKETQHWDADPAFIDAITSILDGSEAVLDTRVLALSAEYEAPFREIKAAGNGFTVARKFYREVTVEKVYDDKTSPTNDQVNKLQEILPGEPVSVGEKILVKYEIWNGENRSFVKLDAAREASLRPVQQLSGPVGGGFIRPLLGSSRWSFSPQGYRNVKTARTEYYFDVYPEENTTVTEEFFVTQAGTFSAPVVTIESLYAPHYCANDAWHGPLQSE